MTYVEQTERDYHGRWRRGVSGNPVGRPRGSKNRQPRRRADQERAAEWTPSDWRVFYRRTFQEAEGVLGENEFQDRVRPTIPPRSAQQRRAFRRHQPLHVVGPLAQQLALALSRMPT